MEVSKTVFCTLRIKKEEVPWNYQQNNYAARKLKQEEAIKEFEHRFFTVLNAVVDSGGVFCMDKYTLDSDHRMYSPQVKIKIPPEAIDRIRAIPDVISVDIDQNQDYNPSPTL